MESKTDEVSKANNYPLYAKYALVLIGLIAGVYILFVLKDVVVPLAFSTLFAILLHPVCAKFESWRLPRILAIILSILLAVIVLGAIVYLASLQISAFADQLPQISKKAENYLEDVLQWVEQTFGLTRNQQVAEGKKYLIKSISESRTLFLNAIVTAGGTLGTMTLVPLYVFFFLLYRDFFRIFFYKAFKGTPNSKLDQILLKIYAIIKSYLAGLGLVIMIVGVLNTIGLLILGVDYAVFFGFLAAFLILIPYIGVLIGSLFPAVMSLITEDNPWIALGVIGVMSFVQFLEGNFITPNIVGSKVSINPFVAIVMLILGGKLWGLSGLILALPLTAILKVILDATPDLEPYGFLLGEPSNEVSEELQKEAKAKEAHYTYKQRNFKNRRRPLTEGAIAEHSPDADKENDPVESGKKKP